VAAVTLAIAKPLLKFTDRIEMYAKLYVEYTSAFARMKSLVNESRWTDLSRQHVSSFFEELRTRAAELF
jgi:hypothetical protein